MIWKRRGDGGGGADDDDDVDDDDDDDDDDDEVGLTLMTGGARIATTWKIRAEN